MLFKKKAVFNRGETGIFFWGGKVIFPDFFPDVKCFFLVENSDFGRPNTNFLRFQKWKAKKTKTKTKQKKRSSPLSVTFPTSNSNFSPSLLPFHNFPSFLLNFYPFPFFPCLFFPDTSAKISWSEVSGGTLPPPPVTPLVFKTLHNTTYRCLFSRNFILD